MIRSILANIHIFLLPVCMQVHGQRVKGKENPQPTYQNPVIHADYSDPDAIAVGDDFYMTASSFNAVPGLPLLHSRDLVHWKLIGYALQKLLPGGIL